MSSKTKFLHCQTKSRRPTQCGSIHNDPNLKQSQTRMSPVLNPYVWWIRTLNAANCSLEGPQVHSASVSTLLVLVLFANLTCKHYFLVNIYYIISFPEPLHKLRLNPFIMCSVMLLINRKADKETNYTENITFLAMEAVIRWIRRKVKKMQWRKRSGGG